MIGDLRDEVWRLRAEGHGARTEDATAAVVPPEDEAGPEQMILSLQAQLVQKNAQIDALKGKTMNVMFVFIVFVVGLVLGKMLVQ